MVMGGFRIIILAILGFAFIISVGSESLNADGERTPTRMNGLASDYYQDIEEAIIATPLNRLRVYNNGRMSNDAANASLDFTTDPDDCASIYLFDGSPLICRDESLLPLGL